MTSVITTSRARRPSLSLAWSLPFEPGLYFAPDDDSVPAQYRGIGVRIEDDILVTATGYENLTASVPKQIDDIEALMAAAQAKREAKKGSKLTRPSEQSATKYDGGWLKMPTSANSCDCRWRPNRLPDGLGATTQIPAKRALSFLINSPVNHVKTRVALHLRCAPKKCSPSMVCGETNWPIAQPFAIFMSRTPIAPVP